jgi:hypothetical protein
VRSAFRELAHHHRPLSSLSWQSAHHLARHTDYFDVADTVVMMQSYVPQYVLLFCLSLSNLSVGSHCLLLDELVM